MKAILPWLLWLWMSVVIVAAFFYAPLAKGFLGESSRILFFHVPMAWVSFVAFLHAAVASLLYLARGRDRRHDRAAAAAVELGLLFSVLATVTGSLWARIMWGAYWNWDPRQTSIVIAMLFYGAYLALRQAVDDGETRARLSAAYALLGAVVAVFLYWIMPRISGFTLHPEPVVNASRKIDIDKPIGYVLMLSAIGFTIFYFWVHNLGCRLAALAERHPTHEG